jgi:hypothetical protein
MGAASQTGACSYNASDTVTKTPWPGTSYLDIAGDRKTNDAFVEGSTAGTYTTPVSCLGISARRILSTFRISSPTTGRGRR